MKSSDLKITEDYLTSMSPFYVPPHARTWMHKMIVLIVSLTVIGIVFLTDYPFLTKMSALIILFAATFPSWLWGTGRVKGIPLYAVYAITYVWTYSLPLVSGNEAVDSYEPSQQFLVAINVALSLFAGTLAWMLTLRKTNLPPQNYYGFDEKIGDAFFLLMVFSLGLFQISLNAEWINVSGKVISILRAAFFGLGSLGIFTFSFNAGLGKLPKIRKILFLVGMTLVLTALSATLFLQVALSLFLLSVIGYTIASKKLPLISLGVVIVCAFVLHHGKGEMRYNHWRKEHTQLSSPLLPWQYPSWFAEWIEHGLADIQYGVEEDENELTKKSGDANLFQRSSLIQMFLLLQEKIQDGSSYLYGQGYSYIPLAIIPRIIYPGKPAPHKGQYLLNDKYGVETQDASGKRTTHIAWGLMAEGFANFGTLGAILVSIFFGTLLGHVGRWSLYTPILSLRTLIAIVVTTTSFQAEWTAGVYFAGLFQALAVIYVFGLLSMKKKGDLYPKALINLSKANALQTARANG